jgi:hypothetical protein
MPEPLTTDELAEAIRVVASVPPGPWPIEPSEFGAPDAVGPICYLQTWTSADQAPVVEFIGYARAVLPKFIGEVSRLLDREKFLERRVRELENAEGGAAHGR